MCASVGSLLSLDLIHLGHIQEYAILTLTLTLTRGLILDNAYN